MLKMADHPWRIIIALALVWGFSQLISPSAAQMKTDTELKDVERALDKGKKLRETLKGKSRDLSRDLGRLKAETVTVAAKIQNHETAILDLEDRLKDLLRTQEDKLALLGQKREQFGHVLMALQRMARHPPEAMIAAPMSPSDTVRGAILLRAAVPAIEDRAATLRENLTALTNARVQAVEKRRELASARVGLDIERQRLDGLMADKTKLKSRADSKTRKAEKRVRQLVKKAKSLRDLMSRLEADRIKREKAKAKKAKSATAKLKIKPPPPPTRGLTQSKLPYPVVGRLVGRYGQAMETGLTRKGITIETGGGAQVVIPRDGTVVFAGAFKGYGQLLIIEHSGGYHSLLAGLARIDNKIGQQVLSGEPAGIMGKAENGAPVLYVELRRKGQPINPLPWLAARKIKVSG